MINRKTMTSLHLGLAAFFMPLLLLMPLSGGLYLLDIKGDQVKTEAFRISAQPPEDKNLQEAFFREIFQQQGVIFNFSQVRGSGKEFSFRPSSRTHYVASLDGTELVFYKIEPDLLKRLMEIHKGHGPKLMRILEILFALSLILTMLSGLWLAWTVKTYRRLTLLSFGAGALVIALCLI